VLRQLDMMPITIRRYRSGDATALWGVYFSAIHQVAAADYSPEQISAWAPESVDSADQAKWAERMFGISPFVAERDGEIVGYADVQPNGYIDHFFVAGGAARQGVGSHLMEHLHAAATSAGLEVLFSDVSVTAKPFFERWGFVVERQQRIVVRGVGLTNFRMRKSRLASNSPVALGQDRAPRIQAYLGDLINVCAHVGQPLVSIVLFGSAASGGFSDVSDVDVLVVVPADTKSESKRSLQAEIARLEVAHGFRPATPVTALRARIERAVGHQFSCFICTRDDLLSGDVARILDLTRWEAPFVDRIVLASIVGSAVTAWGEELLPRVTVPPVRRLDVFKALFGFTCQMVLIVVCFPLLRDATKYAMGVLKHSLHSCFFCYQRRTAAVEDEVEFFGGRLGRSGTLEELLTLRRAYRRAFGFVIRCLPAIARLHLRTARENRF